MQDGPIVLNVCVCVCTQKIKPNEYTYVLGGYSGVSLSKLHISVVFSVHSVYVAFRIKKEINSFFVLF